MPDILPTFVTWVEFFIASCCRWDPPAKRLQLLLIRIRYVCVGVQQSSIFPVMSFVIVISAAADVQYYWLFQTVVIFFVSGGLRGIYVFLASGRDAVTIFFYVSNAPKFGFCPLWQNLALSSALILAFKQMVNIRENTFQPPFIKGGGEWRRGPEKQEDWR